MAQGMEEGALIQLNPTQPQKKDEYYHLGQHSLGSYNIMTNVISQIEKHKKMYDLILMWDTKQKETNKTNKQTHIL